MLWFCITFPCTFLSPLLWSISGVSAPNHCLFMMFTISSFMSPIIAYRKVEHWIIRMVFPPPSTTAESSGTCPMRGPPSSRCLSRVSYLPQLHLCILRDRDGNREPVLVKKIRFLSKSFSIPLSIFKKKKILIFWFFLYIYSSIM